jgi:hypothetical protein
LADRPELLALQGSGVTETSIVIKTCRKDLASYVELQSDLLAFGHSAVRVCAPATDIDAFEPVVAKQFELVSADDLLGCFGWPCRLHDNWYTQQLYKLLLVVTSPTEACWVLDSNTLLLEPLADPWCEERVVLSLGGLQPADRRWFDSSARFLALPPSGPPVAPVNQPLRRSVARALLTWIAGIYCSSPVRVLIASMVAGVRRGGPFWTEYGLYRTYAFHRARQAHFFRRGIRDVAYYRHTREGKQLDEWLGWLKHSRPQMVKVYARRPGFHMSERALRVLCERIRACR